MQCGPRYRQSGASSPEILYFANSTLRITDVHLVTASERLRVAELRNVAQTSIHSYPIASVSGLVAAVEIVLAIPLAVAGGWWVLAAAGVFSAAGGVVGVFVDARRNPRWMSIEVTYRGVRLQVFATGDAREFGQVRRALIRALEVARDRSS